MCGILALNLCKNKEKEDIQKIIDSHKILSNRGPDCSTLIINNKEILGFQRLSINDTSMKGNQPFISKN